MRLIYLLVIVSFFSCGQGADKQKPLQKDPLKTNADTVIAAILPATDSITQTIAAFEKRVAILSGKNWQVVNDSIAQWSKDVFGYFIAPKRKDNPNYPYIATGDFNDDGKQDQAYLITNDARSSYQIAISLNPDNIVFWKEDIDLAAISAMPKTELGGIDGSKVKMKGDGINVEYYEKSSFVLYWNGTSFKRIWTSD